MLNVVLTAFAFIRYLKKKGVFLFFSQEFVLVILKICFLFLMSRFECLSCTTFLLCRL